MVFFTSLSYFICVNSLAIKTTAYLNRRHDMIKLLIYIIVNSAAKEGN